MYFNIKILGVITLNKKIPQQSLRNYFFFKGEGSGMGGDDDMR